MVTAMNLSAQRHEVTDYVDNYYDADGNRHGYCKLFFAPHLAYKKVSSEGNWVHGVKDGIHKNYTSPGVIESQYTYVMGKPIHEKHWDWVILNGDRVRRVIRETEYNKDGSKIIKKLEWNPKTSELVTTYGPLPNGKGYFSTSIYPLDGEDLPRYSEKYNGNDTTYTWFDKSKSILAEKTIIEKNFRISYDTSGNIIFSSNGDGASKRNYKKTSAFGETTEEWEEGDVKYIRQIIERDDYTESTLRCIEDGKSRDIEFTITDNATNDKFLYKDSKPSVGLQQRDYYKNDELLLSIVFSPRSGGKGISVRQLLGMGPASSSLAREVRPVTDMFVPQEIAQLFKFSISDGIVVTAMSSPYTFFTTDYETARKLDPEFGKISAPRKYIGFAKTGDVRYVFDFSGKKTQLTE